ncbi:hypothetical protein PMI13_01350 [Chryseobacterium populi]|uniref:Uncharacterized protein n=1 Tax=Chryseobacterium populi TaxID=1144316 RepID=J2T6U5_9FLAO|nr:hypothetical protein PMI13_01350 [Chryseobacterium populi]
MKKLALVTFFFFIISLGMNYFFYSDYEITTKSIFVLVVSSILFAIFMSFLMKKSNS